MTSEPVNQIPDSPGKAESPARSTSGLKRLLQLPALFCIGCVRLYQILLSPIFGGQCRFVPSCSQYTIEAIRKYGVVKGIAKGTWRILRCNPFCKDGYDPP